MEGVKQYEIASMLRVSENTVSKWARGENWELKRTQKALYEETNYERIQRIAAYQLEVLSALADQYERDESDPAKRKLFDKGDFDAIAKAMASIKSKEIQWKDMVNILRDFLKHLAGEPGGLEKAQQIQQAADDYLNERRKAFRL